MIKYGLNSLPSPRSVAALALAASVAVVLAGCGGGSDTTETPDSSAAAIPSALFASAAPSSALGVGAAKSAAVVGETVVFEGRIGGRRDAFVENRAVFFVTDSSLASCDELHEDDSCRTPWDYCCEPRDNLLKHLATVQVVDDAGRPLATAIEGTHGLEPLATVIVSGVVSEVDESGAFVVNATSIHVREG